MLIKRVFPKTSPGFLSSAIDFRLVNQACYEIYFDRNIDKENFYSIIYS